MRTSTALRAYIEGLTISQGALHGQPMRVLPWQGDFLGLWDTPGDIALSVARKAGKTTFLGAILAAFVDGPLVQPRADVVLVASTFRQALIAFRAAKSFLFPERTLDRKRYRIADSNMMAEIEDRATGARLAAYSSNPDGLHGLQPALCLLDEPAAWKANVRDEVLSILRTGMGAIPGGRIVAIGTRPGDEGHWFGKALEGPRALVYAADDDCDVTDEGQWLKANPSLDQPGFETLLARYRDEAAEAARDDLAEASFRALRLNQGTSPVVDGRELIRASDWKACEADPPADRSGPYALGVDLSGGGALSAVTAYWPRTGALDAFAVVPREPSLEDRGLKDGVGVQYVAMHSRGELMRMGRRVPDYAGMLVEAVRRWGRPSLVAADHYKARHLYEALQDADLERGVRLLFRGGGYKHGSADIREFRRAALEGRVKAPVSLLLRSAFQHARVLLDPQGNCKLAKSSEAGRRTLARDDAAAATVLAVAAGARLPAAPRRRRWAVVG